MDADCLIKLSKSGLKELVCNNFAVLIPRAVKAEVIDDAGGYPDAAIIQKNIDSGLLAIGKVQTLAEKGEEAVLAAFRRGKFDAVCSDDKRFIKRLRLLDIPYITPCVFIAILVKKGKLSLREAGRRLELLSPYVSEEEYSAVKLVLENWRVQ